MERCSFSRRRCGKDCRFTLEVSLQLNTAPGVYTIETVVFDPKRNQPIANGPWVNVTVCDGKSFGGEVQMNPEMVLRSPASPNEQWGPAGLATFNAE